MTELKIVSSVPADTERVEAEDTLTIGQWFWIDRRRLFELENGVDADPSEHQNLTRKLACVSEIGSNYVEVHFVRENGSERVHFDHFEFVAERDHDPMPYINGQIERYKTRVRELMDEVRRVTVQLGVTPRESLAAEGDTSNQSTALAAASGVADIAAHKALLVQTKNETLPELFKQIEDAHSSLAKWMKVPLAPMKAQLALMKGSIKSIEQRIFTVELYAGLVEELELIQDGEAASNDTKISLFQRRHYMDEECLLKYEAGGMKFDDIHDFDHWLLRRENLTRILPHARSIVAFRVRRNDRAAPEWGTLADFITFTNELAADRATFLYIRNGEKVFRLSTEIQFDEQLFPDREHAILLSGGELWMDTSWGRVAADKIQTRAQYEGMLEERAKEDAEYETAMRAWKKLPKKERKLSNEPWHPRRHSMSERWERVTPESVWYDDAINVITHETMKHNRIAVVLQGLLDRSPAFQPHPPWQLWRPEGFQLGIELIYDDSRAMTSGDAPDFDTYRAQLGRSITTNTVVMGQEDIWEAAEAEKENDRRDRSWRNSGRDRHELKRFRPYGNPGPGEFAKPTHVTRTGKATFEWTRAKQGHEWEDNPERPGWLRAKRVPSRLPCKLTVEISRLFNVGAYTPGDFHLFYDDPRTRADYLKWAPYLLAAEDFHAGKRELGNDYEIKQRKGGGDDD